MTKKSSRDLRICPFRVVSQTTLVTNEVSRVFYPANKSKTTAPAWGAVVREGLAARHDRLGSFARELFPEEGNPR
jgi:hypothetical protein